MVTKRNNGINGKLMWINNINGINGHQKELMWINGFELIELMVNLHTWINGELMVPTFNKKLMELMVN